MTPAERREVQRIVGEVLIPEIREHQPKPGAYPEEETLPFVLELFYLAFAIKNAHRDGAMFTARRAASLFGFDPMQVEGFAWLRIAEHMPPTAAH